MKWTKATPEQPGYYWVKKRGWRPRILFFEPVYGNGLEPESGPFSTEGWTWFAGPIEKPTP